MSKQNRNDLIIFTLLIAGSFIALLVQTTALTNLIKVIGA